MQNLDQYIKELEKKISTLENQISNLENEKNAIIATHSKALQNVKLETENKFDNLNNENLSNETGFSFPSVALTSESLNKVIKQIFKI